MQRRHVMRGFFYGLPLSVMAAQVRALNLSGLLGVSDSDAKEGLKTALERGAKFAVDNLGKTDGFLGNPKVRIPLPSSMQSVASLMRSLGQGKRVDELETAMNRAAETAVPEARPLLSNAISSMTVDDAKKIVSGGNTSVTDFFARKTRDPLTVRFLPIVTQATQKVSLARKYDDFASKGARLGLLKPEDAKLENYVTGKALDGLYYMIGEEERRIRADPVGTGSAILAKVFGKL
jgi:hypothetical protein